MRHLYTMDLVMVSAQIAIRDVKFVHARARAPVKIRRPQPMGSLWPFPSQKIQVAAEKDGLVPRGSQPT